MHDLHGCDFPGGILVGETKTRKETRRLPRYLFSCSSGSARSSADGGLLLDRVSPLPSLLCPDLSSTGHHRFSHLRLRRGHVALLLPRGRHLGALAHGGCLSLTHGRWGLHRSDGGRGDGRGDPPGRGHGPENQAPEVKHPRQGAPLWSLYLNNGRKIWTCFI